MICPDCGEEKRHHYGGLCKLCYATWRNEHRGQPRPQRPSARLWLNEYKASLSCQTCGENHPVCLDFHHKDLALKSYSIAYMARGKLGEAKKKRILEEIAKCTVLCANCHRKLHSEGNNQARLNPLTLHRYVTEP